jgi:hypothetical protein
MEVPGFQVSDGPAAGRADLPKGSGFTAFGISRCDALPAGIASGGMTGSGKIENAAKLVLLAMGVRLIHKIGGKAEHALGRERRLAAALFHEVAQPEPVFF